MKVRHIVLGLLSISVIAPIFLYTDRVGSFVNPSSSRRDFLDDVSAFTVSGDTRHLNVLHQETSTALKEPIGVVYSDHSTVTREHKSTRVLSATDEERQQQQLYNPIRQVIDRAAPGLTTTLDSHPNASDISAIELEQQPTQPSGKIVQEHSDNKHDRLTEPADAQVRHLKDQLIRAKVYLSLPAIKNNPHVTRELRLRVKEVTRALGDATKDSDLPKNAVDKLKAMDQSLEKGKQIQDDCAAVVKKLRAMLHSSEEQLRVHKKQTMFLTQLTAKTLPKGLHCLPLRLTTEYYTLNSSQQNFPNQQKLEDPRLYHYALFSDNILAAAVVVNSTISHAKVILFYGDLTRTSFGCWWKKKPFITFNLKFAISFLFLYFFVSVLCQNGSDISPISSPSPFGVSTQQLIFKDRRLAVVYPVIQAFKATITEDPLNRTGNWVGGDICNYTGFYCDNPPDNLSAIALAGIDFNGFLLGAPTLEGFIDKLPDLAIFHANSNKFAGSIPDVSQLKYFYELDVSNNVHAGTFPMTVIGVKDLSFLDIRFNLFSGSVPPEIFNQALEVLFINNNDFTAKLPENFGSTPVRYLTLANNKLTGSIPRGIGNLNMTLIEVLLLNNKLTGCLPYEVGFLKELKLFDVEDNLLTGPLPCSLSCLDKIELLNLANNLFYWEVPEELCALVNLENLTLSGNYFTKVGPACRKLIKNGILDMTQNCVPDLPHQRSLLECTEFYLKYIRFCPYPETYKIIPCKDGYHHHWEGSKAKTMKAPVTYKTLSRHKF